MCGQDNTISQAIESGLIGVIILVYHRGLLASGQDDPISRVIKSGFMAVYWRVDKITISAQ